MSTFQDSDKESTGEQSLILCGFLQVYGNNTEP